MLIIRDQQLRRFAEVADELFFSGVTVEVQRTFWEQTMGKTSADVLAEVREIAQRAVDFGIRADDDVRAFVALEYARGPRFESRLPFAAAILADPGISGGAKMSLLRERIEAGE